MYKIYIFLLLFLFTFPLLNAQTTDGLVAYYPMDGNGVDMGGSGFNGQLFGVSTGFNRFGEAEKALSFDGINDFIEIADAAPLRLGGSYTVSFWVLIEEYDNELAYSVLSKRSGIVQDGYALQIIGNNHPSLNQGELSLLVSGGAVANIQSSETILENNWFNVIVCYNEENSTCTMFFNGVEVNSEIIPPMNDQITATLKIGVDDQSILNNFYFKGTLDELRIYDRILNEEEKEEIAQEGVCDDNDCNTIDTYNQETGLCEYTTITPESCDDANCNTVDSYNTVTCECENAPITPLDCDDSDCQTEDFFNPLTCLCENTPIAIPNCDDANCNTIDSYNADICECENIVIPPPDCDDEDCDTVDFFNTETCLCENEPVNIDSCDDDDCTTTDSYNTVICECENVLLPLPDCDDDNCQTDDFYNPETCLCENTLITVLDCDDNDCTTDDSYNELTCECEHVFVEGSRNVFIPNAISPNDDGINDKWIIYGGDCVKMISSIMIYDRWGNLVYQVKDYELNSNENAWQGELKRQDTNHGVFVYAVEIVYQSGEIEIMKGEINVIK